MWKLSANGTISKVIEPKAGFLENYGFLRDSMDNVYWVERFTVSRFMKKTPKGEIIKIAEGKFKNIRWQYCTKNGIIYFVDVDKLYRIRNGEIDLVAKDLSKNRSGISLQNKMHDVFGIWTDRNDNIYTAIYAANEIVRISPDGVVTTIAKSSAGWSPTGGTEDVHGNLWVLEYNVANKARVRKIVPVEFKSAGWFQQVGIPMFMTAILAAIAVYVAVRIVKAYRG